jgi:glycosyltransferase involved in cell wall biosynthesis
MTPHGEDIQRIPDINYGLRIDKAWDRKITNNLRAADYVTAISNSVHADLDMIPEDRIVDIPNGIHVDSYSGKKSSYLRELLGLPGSSKIVLSVGRNHIKKGYDLGIKAISKVINEYNYTNVHYVIIGRDVKQHEKLIHECKVDGYVTLVDELPSSDIIKCYKSADIFFSPSVVEGLSLVSIEAMAAGLPLVVTNVPGNDDVVKANGCGLIVENRNPDDMANGLLKLLGNLQYRMKLSELSMQNCVNYDWSEIAEKYINVYKMAIRRHNRTYM